MYSLYGSVASRAFRPLWLLEELGVAYTHVPVGPQSPEVRAISPLGKIPVLQDGTDVIADSSAIMTYLADKHGALTAPAGTAARGAQDAMTFRLLDELDAVLWTAARHSFILPEADRVPEVKDSLKREFARNLERLEKEMSGPFVMGAQFSLPDIILCHCLGWAHKAGFPPAPESLVDYARRLRGRAAFQAAAAK